MFDSVNFERTNNIGLTIWSKKYLLQHWTLEMFLDIVRVKSSVKI